MPSDRSECEATTWHLVVWYWGRTVLGRNITFWRWIDDWLPYCHRPARGTGLVTPLDHPFIVISSSMLGKLPLGLIIDIVGVLGGISAECGLCRPCKFAAGDR